MPDTHARTGGTMVEDPDKNTLYTLLTQLCGDLAVGRRADADMLFALTKEGSGPEGLVRLAEAFGMMLVRVEAREFQNTQLIQELRTRNAELEALHQVLVARNEALEKSMDEMCSPGQGIIGQSDSMRKVFELAKSIAHRPINTLILGATGTGKEVLARYMHQQSPRRGKPFIAVNCTAIPDTLFESAMFGIEKGVATGVTQRKGLIEEADGGTLFLDEIGEMSLANQSKLLRVLELGEVTRLGSARPVPVDIHLISATNAKLEDAVREGRFREDLYYRINVVEVRLPLLRERGEDILLLAQVFLERFCAEMGRGRMTLSPSVQGLFLRYPWPGNVRELHNEMKRAAALTAGDRVELPDLSARILDSESGKNYTSQAGMVQEQNTLPLNLEQAEEILIAKALKETGGIKAKAAELLGITREGLRKKLLRMEGEGK